MVPEGWRECKLGELFESSREKGKPGLPTMSVTLNEGLVLRESLERKTETNLSSEEHLRIRNGYIAYNMMRMWQGASGLSHGEALVSPAYVVLKPTPQIDPTFASYFFKAARTIYLFWAYSYGLTKDRLRLYYPDFSLIPVVVPPIDEQKRIGEILSTWDRAIGAVKALIENTELQKRASVRRIFCSVLSQNWPETELGTLGKFRKGSGISRGECTNSGIPCIRYGEIYTHHHDVVHSFSSYVSPEIAASSTKILPGDILFTASGETADEIGKCVAFTREEEAYAGGDIILFSSTEINPVFLAYQLNSPFLVRQKMRYAQGQSVVHISATNLAKLKLRMPERSIQDRIASILLDLDCYITDLRQENQLLLDEKKALMQQLLTGKRRVKVDGDVDRIVEEAAAHG